MVSTVIFSIETLYLPFIGSIIGFILGYRIKTKINIIFYLIISLIIGYLVGPFPYYDFPISITCVLTFLGLILGNLITKKEK